MYRVRIETTKGIILLSVTRALAPRGADRFYHLVQVGFYDNSRFFRVISGRFAQFGIAGDPVVAKIWQNERFPDDPVKDSNVRGTFAFAMTGPDARTTQIYINTGDQSRLDPMGFAPFGKVVEGMSVKKGPYELAANVLDSKLEVRVLIYGVMAAMERGCANVEALLIGDFVGRNQAGGVASSSGGNRRIERMRKGVSERDAWGRRLD